MEWSPARSMATALEDIQQYQQIGPPYTDLRRLIGLSIG